MRLNKLLLCVATLSFVAANVSPAAPPQYSVTVLDHFPGSTNATPYAINDLGQVTGVFILNPPFSEHAARWTGTTPIDLGASDRGFAINDAGHVVGFRPVGAGSAFIFDGTTSSPLFGLDGRSAIAFGINASGQVVGVSNTSIGGEVRAVVWDGGVATSLGTLGGKDSEAHGINDAGQITGHARDSSTQYKAFRWDGTTMVSLGTLGGDSSQAYNINASGQVVGSAQLSNSAAHAVRWTGTTATDLGTLGGGASFGYGINDAGDVTGMSQTSTNANHAFIYTGGTMYDLMDLLPVDSGITYLAISSSGNSINNSGQIVAQALIGGESRAVIFSPVPEPSCGILLLTATTLLGLRLRTRDVPSV